jgi:hypothetical protein
MPRADKKYIKPKLPNLSVKRDLIICKMTLAINIISDK